MEKLIDLGLTPSISGATAFNGCCALIAVVLRRTAGITTLTNLLFNLPMLYSGGLHIYVPRALISSYQTATNWSTMCGISPNLFRALEDYTVDGTTSGELDLSRTYTPHTPVYTLTDTHFDGTTDIIDTGISLYDSTHNGVYTLVFDLTAETQKGNGRKIFQCADTSVNPIRGISHQHNTGSLTGHIFTFNPDGTNRASNISVAPHIKGYLTAYGTHCVLHMFNQETGDYTGQAAWDLTTTLVNHNKTLLIGGGRDANDNIVDRWTGTVNSFRVYDEALTPIEAMTILGLDTE